MTHEGKIKHINDIKRNLTDHCTNISTNKYINTYVGNSYLHTYTDCIIK